MKLYLVWEKIYCDDYFSRTVFSHANLLGIFTSEDEAKSFFAKQSKDSEYYKTELTTVNEDDTDPYAFHAAFTNIWTPND